MNCSFFFLHFILDFDWSWNRVIECKALWDILFFNKDQKTMCAKIVKVPKTVVGNRFP